ncbi:MAG: ribose-phosphate pyrophosphokinase [Planctomycetales bacterium]|nr:ribose-phosphate pyrophosphokinase [Planctomycetales bacterium]
MTKNHDLKVFSGNANRKLAEEICRELKTSLGDAVVDKFPDGEINIKINEDIRGRDVYIVQPTCPPVNQNLMELLVLIDCARRASADRVTAVIPYYGYARKDRKDEGRVPITAKLVANLLTTAGADRVLALDLHAAQIQGFFDIPVDHLYAAPVFLKYVQEKGLRNLTVVGPDVGAIKMARAYSRRLGAGLAIVDKRRISGDEAVVYHVIGDVEGQTVLVVDDMIATGGSILEAAQILKSKGAGKIIVCATHPVLCGPAIERLRQAPVEEVVVTNTIPLEGKEFAKLRALSVAPLLAEAIQRIHRSESVSSLFPP